MAERSSRPTFCISCPSSPPSCPAHSMICITATFPKFRANGKKFQNRLNSSGAFPPVLAPTSDWPHSGSGDGGRFHIPDTAAQGILPPPSHGHLCPAASNLEISCILQNAAQRLLNQQSTKSHLVPRTRWLDNVPFDTNSPWRE